MATPVTKYDVEQWLDTQVEGFKLSKIELEVNDDGDKLCNIGVHDGIHLQAEALRFIAEKVKLDIYLKGRNGRSKDDEYAYQLSIFWKGIEFFAIESEEEYKERGAVV